MPLTSSRRRYRNAIRAALPTLSVAALALSACSVTPPQTAEQSPSPEMLLVRGSLAYRERVALPPDSAAHISVLDVSIADRAADVIAAEIVELQGRQVPITFEIPVDRKKLQSNHRYALRGTIQSSSGDLLWTTTEVHVVDPNVPSPDLGVLTLTRVPS